MTRMFATATALITLLWPASFAACLPGQDILTKASVEYSTINQISTGAFVDFLDQSNAPSQAASQPSVLIVETSALSVSDAPAVTFIAPEDASPLYYISARALYYGPSLAGKRVKLAGKLLLNDGAAFIDDGTTLAVRNLERPYGSTCERLLVGLRKDIISSLPKAGSLVTVQGVVRRENDGQCTILPLTDNHISVVR